MITVKNLLELCKVQQSRVDTFAPIIESHRSSFSSEENFLLFLANIFTETGRLAKIEEGFNWSAAGLVKFFPSYFPNVQAAQQVIAQGPQAIANKIYGRVSLGNTQPGDGWKYRGRGLLQTTGKANYQTLSKAVGVDYVTNPDELLKPEVAVKSAVFYWNSRCKGVTDLTQSRKLVNGGLNGIDECKANYQLLKSKYQA